MSKPKRSKSKSNTRNNTYQHFTNVIRNTMETPAWQALPTNAQALYPWLKLEWKGDNYNNNGKISLSVRQAAQRLGVTQDTASKAFRELQAKGFIVCTQEAYLSDGGSAKLQTYELTELRMSGNKLPKKLYNDWEQGKDFPIISPSSNNPTGRNGKK